MYLLLTNINLNQNQSNLLQQTYIRTALPRVSAMEVLISIHFQEDDLFAFNVVLYFEICILFETANRFTS